MLVLVIVIVLVIDLSCRFFRFPPFVPPMINGEQGMPHRHARTRVTHGLFDALPHPGLVAMHPAFGARGLGFLKRATLELLASIFQELAAFGAKLPRAGVMAPPAINQNHRRDGLGFTPKTDG